MIIQIIGLPGSGKTALAESLKERINAIHLNADEVRSGLNNDLGFSLEDRVEHARRMGELARLISKQGFNVVVDFVCPTEETRKSFGFANFVVWMNTIDQSRFDDTNKMFEHPTYYDLKFDNHILEAYSKASRVIEEAGIFDWSAPTTLQLGRYQPWHKGHQSLKNEAHKRTDQVLVGVRNTYNTSEKDPMPYEQVRYYIELDNFDKNTLIMRLPNITNIVYGRDVGYKIEQIELSKDIQAISATQKRKEMGL